MSNLVLYAIPGFVVLMLVELAWSRRARAEGRPVIGYTPVDTAASLAMGLGNVAISAVTKLGAFALFTLAYEHRLFDLGTGAAAWAALFVAEDFCYYWFHRLHHQVRLLWAAHVNHHSSTHYNLSTALRQSWTTPLTGPLFWVPLALAGFAPWMIVTAQAWSLLYQFWIHTESIRSLGPLEAVFNTPSHHRVHHGANVEYLDRNHGGILIVWDRLFGTFEPEQAPVRFGLTTNLDTHRLDRVAFHEFAAIARDVRRAPTLRTALGYVFGPPGWSHDGRTLTAAQMRAVAPGPAAAAPAPGG
jgi:sterol desaturase/sphingolipid hydroxylase (fatty acid hydroxylase superfamily)